MPRRRVVPTEEAFEAGFEKEERGPASRISEEVRGEAAIERSDGARVGGEGTDNGHCRCALESGSRRT